MPVPEKDVEDSPPYSRHLVTDYAEDWLLNARVVKLRTADLGVSGARPKVGPPVPGLRTGLTLAESTGTAEALTHPTMSPSSTSTRMRSLQSEGASQPVASQSQTLQPAGASQHVASQFQTLQPGASQPVASQSQALQPEDASQPVASQSQAWWPQGASWPAASQTQALQPREDRWSVASQSPGHMPGATQGIDLQTSSESTPDQQA